MTLPIKTGIVIATLLIKRLCHVLTTYRPVMNEVIAAAVLAGHITSLQADVLATWLDSAQGACNIIRTISGY
jgi:hypothetical protein